MHVKRSAGSSGGGSSISVDQGLSSTAEEVEARIYQDEQCESTPHSHPVRPLIVAFDGAVFFSYGRLVLLATVRPRRWTCACF